MHQDMTFKRKNGQENEQKEHTLVILARHR